MALVSVALSWLPPSVAKRFSADRTYRAEWRVKLGGTFNVGPAKIASEALIPAIEAAYASEAAVSVEDEAGDVWQLQRWEINDERWNLALSRDASRHLLKPFVGFLPTSEQREDAFGRILRSRQLDEEREEYWRTLLRERKLSFEEMDELDDDLALTPGGMASTIASAYQQRGTSAEQLVPNNEIYYDRLVGKWTGSENILEYAEREWPHFLAQRLGREVDAEALLDCLRLCWHSTLVAKIPADAFTEEQVSTAIQRLLGPEAIIAKTSCVEFCLRNLDRWPSVETSLVELVEGLKSIAAEGDDSQFRLQSALFAMCEGRVSHTRTMSSAPTFWRRLATLSHASVLEKELLTSGISSGHFSTWASGVHNLDFNLQSLCDLRLEPRWLSSMAQAGQLHAELYGRISGLALLKQKELPAKLKKALLRGKKSLLISESEQLNVFMPGPLEGGTEPQAAAPRELAEASRERLQERPLRYAALWGFVNATLIFKSDAKLAEDAAEAVRATRLGLIEDAGENAADLLQALAFLSAITRSRPLADEVRILMRALLRLNPKSIPPFDYVNLVLRSAAANPVEEEWGKRIGELFTERSFDDDFQASEAFAYVECLRWLRASYPSLWKELGRSIAAFEARAALVQ